MESADKGDQTATVTTEHTLATETDAGTYILVVDTGNMVAEDVLILRIKTKNQSGDSSILAYIATYSHVQSEPQKYSVPVPVDTEIICTLEQSEGTSRVFPWNLLKV